MLLSPPPSEWLGGGVNWETEGLRERPQGGLLDRTEGRGTLCRSRRGMGVGQGEEALELLVDGLGQGEGIEPLAEGVELGDLPRIGEDARTRSRGVWGRS